MKFDTNTIVTLKIIGGDELIARLGDDYSPGDLQILLKKPMVVMMGQEGFGLAPFALTAELTDTPVRIQTGNVLTVSKTIQQVAEHYMKQTTGLVGLT